MSKEIKIIDVTDKKKVACPKCGLVVDVPPRTIGMEKLHAPKPLYILMNEYATMRNKKPTIPLVLTFLIGIGWLIFLLLYTLYWSVDFTLFQNIVFVVISLLVAAALIGLTWILWGTSWLRRF